MREWFEGIVGPEYATAAMIGAAVLIALILLLILWRLMRRLSRGTYVAGGRNRKTRLAVMDATVVDHHRRLVLVRRDDVEHLILIGGAADVVVERDIRVGGQARRPAPAPEPMLEAPIAPEPPTPVRPAPLAPVRHAAPAPRPTISHEPPAPRPAPVAPVRPAPPVVNRPVVTPPPPPATVSDKKSVDEDLDDDLLRELEVSLDDEKPANPKDPTLSLDEEMAKLLGELSDNKR